MRKLKADEIECRVSQVTAKGCSLLLYKTARVDRAILDEEFGQFGWQNDFKVIDGKMYGGIGVCYDNNGQREWVWKWDCGIESNTEAEKGQASDCFKRAGFKWGIGVELYTAPFIFVQCETQKGSNGKYGLVNQYVKYQVTDIGYSEKGDINKLQIKNSNDEIVFELGKAQKKAQPKDTITQDDKALISGASQCKTTAELENFYKEISPLLSGNKARLALVDKCKEIKKELQNG